MKRTLGTEVDLGARYPWRLLFSLYLFKHVDLFKMLRSNGATAFLSLTYGISFLFYSNRLEKEPPPPDGM